MRHLLLGFFLLTLTSPVLGQEAPARMGNHVLKKLKKGNSI
ncbi:hypothetical protein [Rhodocaloribacter sp.]